MERLRITVNGKSYEVLVEVLSAGEEVRPAQPAQHVAVTQPVKEIKKSVSAVPASSPPLKSAGLKQYTAPLPGKVVVVKVAQGEQVRVGQTLLILETMKMENELTAPWDGVVEGVHVSEGQTVQAGDILISIA